MGKAMVVSFTINNHFHVSLSTTVRYVSWNFVNTLKLIYTIVINLCGPTCTFSIDWSGYDPRLWFMQYSKHKPVDSKLNGCTYRLNYDW